jgi:hypothetical protein
MLDHTAIAATMLDAALAGLRRKTRVPEPA